MIYNALVVIVKLFMLLCYRVRITGRENITGGAAVVCANHTAQHDPVFIIGAFGKTQRLYPLSKVENKDKFFLGWALKKIGVIFVDRGKSDIGAIKQSMQVLKSDNKLLIFPEGTRVREGQSVEAKRGGIMLAVRNNAPILPVYVTPGVKRPFSRVNVVIGEPYRIEVQGKPSGDFMDAKAAELMQKITLLGRDYENG